MIERDHLRRRLIPFFGPHRLDRINLALIRDFVGGLKSTGFEVEGPDGKKARRPYSAAVVNQALSILRKYLRDALERDVLDRYPVKRRLPKEKEAPLRMEMSPDELGRFLGVFDDEAGFCRYVEENRSRGRLLASPFYRGGKARAFGGGLRPDGEAVGYRFVRFHALKPVFLVALESGGLGRATFWPSGGRMWTLRTS